MSDHPLYPEPSADLARHRRELVALRDGATEAEIMEAIWVAAEMRAGGAFAHATVALAAMRDHAHPRSDAAAAPAPSPQPH